jgi:spermidine synthase
VLTFPIRSGKLQLSASVRRQIVKERSKFQTIEIFETDAFGKALLLDGHIQLTEFDEQAYHELLVWIPLLNIHMPKRALIVGGGDGGVARELCRHPEIETIDMVEIDEAVVRLCREHMPTVSSGAFGDPRLNLHLEDAFEFVRRATEPYDLIVADSTDVYEDEEGELSERLFTVEFYRDLRRILSPAGFVVTQADNPVFCPYSLKDVTAAFQSVFPLVGSYWGLVPSFGGFSAFCWGSNGGRLPDAWPATERTYSYLDERTYGLAFSRLPFASRP